MSAAWAILIPAAVGFALSPVPLIELILVLFSKRRAVNAVAFVTVLIVSAVLGLALGYGGGRAAGGEHGGTSTVGAVLLLVLGIVLTVVGIKNWRNRGDHSEPAVLAMIGRMGPLAVASLALGATILNPKNLVILLGAGQALTSLSGAGVVGASSSCSPTRHPTSPAPA